MRYIFFPIALFVALIGTIPVSAEVTLSVDRQTAFAGNSCVLNVYAELNGEAVAGINAKVSLPQGVICSAASLETSFENDFVFEWDTFQNDSEHGVIFLMYSASGTQAITETGEAICHLVVDIAPTVAADIYPMLFSENSFLFEVNTAHAVSNHDGSLSLPHTVTPGALGVIQNEEILSVPIIYWPLIILLGFIAVWKIYRLEFRRQSA